MAPLIEDRDGGRWSLNTVFEALGGVPEDTNGR
jgi:hypothetical protein